MWTIAFLATLSASYVFCVEPLNGQDGSCQLENNCNGQGLYGNILQKFKNFKKNLISCIQSPV